MAIQKANVNKRYGPYPGDTVLYQLADKWDIRFRQETPKLLWPEYWWEYKHMRAIANVSEFLRCAAEGRCFIPVDMDGPYTLDS